MAINSCNVVVTWLDRVSHAKLSVRHCVMEIRCFNEKQWIAFQRDYGNDYVMEVSLIREFYIDAYFHNRLSITGQTVILLVEFENSSETEKWFQEIKRLRSGRSATVSRPEATAIGAPASKHLAASDTSDTAVEIPYALRESVKLAITEAGALGTIGAFSTALDVANIAVWWGYLLVEYSRYYGVKVDKATAKKICSTALLGMGGYYLGCATATKLFHLIPGAGTLTAMGISALQNIIFTYRFAMTLTRIFRRRTVDINTLADSIIQMYAGTFSGFRSLIDIWKLLTDQ